MLLVPGDGAVDGINLVLRLTEAEQGNIFRGSSSNTRGDLLTINRRKHTFLLIV